MKYLLNIFTFIVLSSCIHSHNGKQEINKKISVDSVIISFVNFDILTISDVSCHEFDEAFSDARFVVLREKAVVNELIGLLDSLQVISNDEHIDTRAKIYIYIGNDIIPVCIDRNFVYYKNQYFVASTKFLDLFNAIIKKGKSILKPHANLNIEKPVFLGEDGDLYKLIKTRMSYLRDSFYIQDTLKLLVEFNIDNNGNGVDVLIRNRKEKNRIDTSFMNSYIGAEIVNIISKESKWSSSKYREPKVKSFIPIVIYPSSK